MFCFNFTISSAYRLKKEKENLKKNKKHLHISGKCRMQVFYLLQVFPALSLPGASSLLRPHLRYLLHSPTVWRPTSLPSWSWEYPKHLFNFYKNKQTNKKSTSFQTHSCIPLLNKPVCLKINKSDYIKINTDFNSICNFY